ncbi:MAG: S-layer homology domain-containing protein [Syntrophomonadaceae bacterium]|nr:S-layer homology domain-containing protein [Syntrophomonadaceae bacterium]
MKKVTIYLVVLSLVVTILTPGKALAASLTFSDIKGHWAETQIQRLAQSGYVKGYVDKTFKPDRSMTRAEFICLLLNGQGVTPAVTASRSFSDTVNHWAGAHIEEAVKRGIIVPNEFTNGFKPDVPIKRSEVAAAIVRALGKSADVGEIPPFKDRDQVARSTYKGFITVAYDEGLMRGFETGEFKPFDLFTRAQACALLGLYLDKIGISLPDLADKISPDPSGVAINPEKDNLNTLQIYNQSYNIGSFPLNFKIDTREIRVSAISQLNDNLYLNYSTRLPLNGGFNNLEISLNNNRWGVRNLQVVNRNLVVIPAYWKINNLSYDEQKFNTDFIDLYIGSESSGYSLAEVEILEDPYSLRIEGSVYNLDQDNIIIDLRDQFYRVKKVITVANADTRLQLEPTEPVVIKRPEMSNISAIFVGNKTLDLNKIQNIYFLIDGNKHSLSECSIDASGNFTVNRKSYPAEQILMLINGIGYQLNEVVKLRDSKLVFNCGADGKKWAKINYQYRDAAGVVILINNVAYDLDRVTVVKRNIIRVKGKQYDLDATFKCRFDDRTYNIDEIDYDTSLDIITIDTSEASDDFLQPKDYVFYLKDTIYQKGWSDEVAFYVKGNWEPFNYIYLSDPAHFRFDNTTYEIIGTRVRIGNERFKIIDTAWRGATQVFNLYLEEI